MNLNKFKKLHEKYKKLPLPKEVWDTPEYEDYSNAIHDDYECGQYYLEAQLKDKGVSHTDYCCLQMAHKIFFPDDRDDVDQIVIFSKSQKTYGIPVHDGGTSFITIDYCPWCGSNIKNPPS